MNSFPIFAALFVFANANVLDIQSDKQFKEITTNNGYVLVKFFAPWCGHCKKLAPEFVSAAKSLKESASNVVLVEVDCTKDDLKSTCARYEVKGYPTMKFFVPNEKQPQDYTAARTKESIVQFTMRMITDAITHVHSHDDLMDLVSKHNIVVVEYSKSKNSAIFNQLSKDLKMVYKFVKITNASLIKEHNTTHDDIAVFRDFDEAQVVFEKGKRSVRDWLTHHSMPLVGELTPENFADYMAKDLPILWMAIDKEDKWLSVAKSLSPAFKDRKESLLAVYIDSQKFGQALKGFGFSETYPQAIIFEKDETKYKFDGKEFTAETLKKFIDDYEAKKLKPFLKSAEAPKKNDGPITEIVGTTFNSIVMDEEKDVVVEYYLTYCQHCKTFAPKYAEVSRAFAHSPTVVIAKFNGEDNDSPLKVKGYPTLVLFLSGKKGAPLTYDGKMESADVERWISENAILSKQKTDKKETPKDEL